MAKLPTLHPLKSSNIEAAGHEGTDLFIRFKGGAVYHYEGVSKAVYDNMLKSPSIGSFVATQVRGKYTHRKLDDVPSHGG